MRGSVIGGSALVEEIVTGMLGTVASCMCFEVFSI